MSLTTAREEIEGICIKSGRRSQCFRPGKYFSFPWLCVSHNPPIGSHGHLSGMRHHYESSSRYPYLSVEPGDGNDLAEIVRDRG